MTRFTPHLAAGLIMSYFIACSPVKFEKDPNFNRCQNFSQDCVTANGYDQFDYSIVLSGGQVDILFVDDNSGSMSFEHEKIASRFPTFLAELDARELDYRIGIITTDIASGENEPRSINENGALQNGRLIRFSNGDRFLTPNTANKAALFRETIERPETLQCDNFIKSAQANGLSRSSSEYVSNYHENCPSGDERGVYSAYLAVNENLDGFIRDRAHLAIVVISDENNRSQGITDPMKKYALQNVDLPETLISLVDNKFQGDKTLAGHAIVVKSGDSACLSAQNAQLNQWVNGSYGTVYENFAGLTNGVIGSVCAEDYGQQMGTIGAAIVNQVNTIPIACENPKDLDVQITPEMTSNVWTVTGKQISFASPLEAGVQVRVRYSCPQL